MLRIPRWTVWCLAQGALLLGCGRPAPPPAAAPTAPTAPAIERIDLASLPKLGDPSPPLDEGRLEAAGPADWSLAPRRPDWLIAWQITPGTPYPIIMVDAQDAAGAAAPTAETAATLAAELERELSAAGAAVAQQPRPVAIGPAWWVEYVRHAKAGDTALERLLLVSIIQGRRCTVELRTHFGTLDIHRPHALAVASSLRAPAPLGAEGAPPADAPPSDSPAVPPEVPAGDAPPPAP